MEWKSTTTLKLVFACRHNHVHMDTLTHMPMGDIYTRTSTSAWLHSLHFYTYIYSELPSSSPNDTWISLIISVSPSVGHMFQNHKNNWGLFSHIWLVKFWLESSIRQPPLPFDLNPKVRTKASQDQSQKIYPACHGIDTTIQAGRRRRKKKKKRWIHSLSTTYKSRN